MIFFHKITNNQYHDQPKKAATLPAILNWNHEEDTNFIWVKFHNIERAWKKMTTCIALITTPIPLLTLYTKSSPHWTFIVLFTGAKPWYRPYITPIKCCAWSVLVRWWEQGHSMCVNETVMDRPHHLLTSMYAGHRLDLSIVCHLFMCVIC